MAADFSLSQIAGSPSIVVLTDTSTGLVGVTDRFVYLQKADGSYLVPTGTTTSFIEWPAAQTSINIDALDKDYSLIVLVQWISGSSIAYTKQYLRCFRLYGDTQVYQLTQFQSSDDSLLANANFYQYKSNLMTELDSAEQANDLASDQAGSQACLDRATYLRLNPQLAY